MRPRVSSRCRLAILLRRSLRSRSPSCGCARDPEPASPAATLDPSRRQGLHRGRRAPWAEAVAIAGDRILAVGTDAEVLALAGDATERIDLGGRVVIPGLNDAHVHTAAAAPAPTTSGCRSILRSPRCSTPSAPPSTRPRPEPGSREPSAARCSTTRRRAAPRSTAWRREHPGAAHGLDRTRPPAQHARRCARSTSTASGRPGSPAGSSRTPPAIRPGSSTATKDSASRRRARARRTTRRASPRSRPSPARR